MWMLIFFSDQRAVCFSELFFAVSVLFSHYEISGPHSQKSIFLLQTQWYKYVSFLLKNLKYFSSCSASVTNVPKSTPRERNCERVRKKNEVRGKGVLSSPTRGRGVFFSLSLTLTLSFTLTTSRLLFMFCSPQQARSFACSLDGFLAPSRLFTIKPYYICRYSVYYIMVTFCFIYG